MLEGQVDRVVAVPAGGGGVEDDAGIRLDQEFSLADNAADLVWVRLNQSSGHA